MPLDPRLSRIARRQQNVRITQRHRANARQSGAPGGVPIYVDPARLIAVDPADSTQTTYYNQFDARIRAVSTEMKIATGTTTYAEFVAAYDAMTANEKSLPLMTNIEFPWLAILTAADADSVVAAWRTDAAVIAEFTRYNGLVGTSYDPATATMANFKAVAERLWQDCHAYARAGGSPRIVPYGSDGVGSIGFTFGIPIASVWANPGPNSTIEYYAESLPSIASLSSRSAAVPAGTIQSLMRATRGCDAWGQSAYCFYPTNGLSVSNIADWTDGSVVRRINNSAQSEPPAYMGLASYQSWMAQHVRAMIAHSKIARDLAVAADSTLATSFPSGLAIFAWLGFVTDVVANYITKNHFGVGDTDPAERARILYGGIFASNSSLDSASRVLPTEIWVWDFARFFEGTQLCTRAYSTGSPYTYRMQVLVQRYAWERMCIGRPMTPPGSPIGNEAAGAFDTPTSPAVPDGTNGGTHWNWFWNNTLTEATYYNNGSTFFPASTTWWDGAATTLPGGLSLEDGVLAPYLDFSRTITGTAVKNAWNRYATEYRVRQLEAMAEVIAGY